MYIYIIIYVYFLIYIHYTYTCFAEFCGLCSAQLALTFSVFSYIQNKITHSTHSQQHKQFK